MFVENASFRDLMNSVSGKTLPFPCANTITSELQNEYIQLKATLKNKLCEEAEYVCTTADAWSSKGQSFMGITVHYLDTSLTRRSFLLAFKKLYGKQSYDILAKIMHETYMEFGIAIEKITHTVTDGGKNFAKAFKEFAVDDAVLDDHNVEENDSDYESYPLDDSDISDTEENTIEDTPNEADSEENIISHELEFRNFSDDFDGIRLPRQQRCMSHLMNLVGSSDFKKKLNSDIPLSFRSFKWAVNKLKIFWNLSSRSSRVKCIVQDICKRSFPYPSTIRWNSLYDSIKVASQYKEMINTAIDNINKNVKPRKRLEKINVHEWLLLDDYLTCMKPIASALDKFQGEDNISIGYILPLLFFVDFKFRDMNISTAHGKNFRTCVVACFVNRFRKIMEIDDENIELIVAAVCIPKFKLSWIDDEIMRETCQSIFINELSKITRNSSNDFDNQFDDTIERSVGTSHNDSFVSFTLSKAPIRRTSNEHCGAAIEALTYLNSYDNSIEGLNKFPLIYNLYKKMNTTITSSAPVERLFSNALIIFNPRRNRISAKHFEMTLFIKKNKKMIFQ